MGGLWSCRMHLSVCRYRWAENTSNSASAGFARNLRKAMYENIQTFSFSNIDKFSTAGLVTRLTTDVTNLQNAYQMILRMCVRAPISSDLCHDHGIFYQCKSCKHLSGSRYPWYVCFYHVRALNILSGISKIR